MAQTTYIAQEERAKAAGSLRPSYLLQSAKKACDWHECASFLSADIFEGLIYDDKQSSRLWSRRGHNFVVEASLRRAARRRYIRTTQWRRHGSAPPRRRRLSCQIPHEWNCCQQLPNASLSFSSSLWLAWLCWLCLDTVVKIVMWFSWENRFLSLGSFSTVEPFWF